MTGGEAGSAKKSGDAPLEGVDDMVGSGRAEGPGDRQRRARSGKSLSPFCSVIAHSLVL